MRQFIPFTVTHLSWRTVPGQVCDRGHYIRQAQIIPAFLPRFDTAQPITKQQDHDTSQRRKAQIQRAQRKKRPAAPDTDKMSQKESQDAQDKIQKQSPEASISYQMIERAIE
jgi:hypothetical protein